MATPSNLRVDYLSLHEMTSRPEAWWQTVLGVAPFGRASEFPGDRDIPIAPIGLKELGAESATCEVWQVAEPLSSGRTDLVHYRAGEHILFGRVVIAEPEPSMRANGGPTAIQQVTFKAYAEIFATLDRLGYPYLLRIWNYLPEINRETPHGERYRQFNSARRRAFLSSQRAVEGDVPAACALGSAAGCPLVVYFLASPTPGRTIENPRQVSAYQYPSEHGPDSPTFSRAAVFTRALGELLLISGTASIVGHRTVHVGDAAAQTRESIANIAALVDAANEMVGACVYSIDSLQYKVYVRHAKDLAVIRGELANRPRTGLPITYLQADICRSNLLVEIEAVGRPSHQ